MIKVKVFCIVFIICCIFTQDVHPATALRITPKRVNIGIIKADDYEKGYVEQIRGNMLRLRDTQNDWKLLVKTNDSDMGVVHSYIKPISDFHWKAQGDYATQTQYTDITNYDIEVARGTRGSSFRRVTMDYKILLSWLEDLPGNYELTLLYTLTTQ